MSTGNDAEGPLLVADIMDKIDHPHHGAVDALAPEMIAVFGILSPISPVRTGGIAAVADANLRVVYRRPPQNDGICVLHSRLVPDEKVKGRIGIPEILYDEGLALFSGPLDVIALFLVGMVVPAPAAVFARRQVYVSHRVFLQRVNRSGELSYFSRT